LLYRKPQRITALLDAFLRSEGLITPLARFRAEEAVTHVIGEKYAKYVGEVSFHGEKLHVQIKSAPLRHNLMMNRKAYIHAINHEAGAQVVQDIVFC
jgi:hypothetical protein